MARNRPRAKKAMIAETTIQRRPTSAMGEISPTAKRAATTLPPQTSELKVSSSQGLRMMREGRGLRSFGFMGVAPAAPRS